MYSSHYNMLQKGSKGVDFMLKRYPEVAAMIAEMVTEMPPEKRLPGSALLAERFGVNQRTVMKALHLLAAKNLVVIRGTGGVYPVKKSVPSRRRSGIIAVVGVASDTELAGFIREKLSDSGYRPVFLDFDPEVFEENPAFVLNFPADGFLFRFSTNFNLRIEKHLSDIHMPFVLLNSHDEYEFADSSSNDLRKGWKLLLSYLVEQGCRKIAFIEGKPAPGYEKYEEHIQQIFSEQLGDSLFGGKCFFLDYGQDTVKLFDILVDEFLKLEDPPDAIVTGSGVLANFLLAKFPEPHSFYIGASWDSNSLPPPGFLCAFHDSHDRAGWALDRLILRIDGDTRPWEHHISPVRLQIPANEKISSETTI